MKNFEKELEQFDVYHQIKRKEIPDSMPTFDKPWDIPFETAMSMYTLREYATKQLGFAYVSWDWVKPFASWIGKRSVLEVLSGKGALSYALQTCGVDILPTDDYSWFPSINKDDWWTNVEDIDALAAIRKYGWKRDILLMSWIPYQSSIGYEAIKLYHELNPNGLVVVIGESYGGCTADDTFFENFEEIHDEDFLKSVENFKSWQGIHDYPAIGKYSKKD